MEAVGTMDVGYQAPNTELMSFKPVFVKLPFSGFKHQFIRLHLALLFWLVSQ